MIIKVPIFVEIANPPKPELLHEYVAELGDKFQKVLRLSPNTREKCPELRPTVREKAKVLEIAILSRRQALEHLRTK